MISFSRNCISSLSLTYQQITVASDECTTSRFLIISQSLPMFSVNKVSALLLEGLYYSVSIKSCKARWLPVTLKIYNDRQLMLSLETLSISRFLNH